MKQLATTKPATDRLHDQFPILSISRADLKDIGYDVSKVSDAKMIQIALRLADTEYRPRFSEFVDLMARDLNIPKDRNAKKIETIESLLGDAHETEIIRNGAEAWNIGWGGVPDGISPKTSKGILVSVINRKSKKVSHRWHPYKYWYGRRVPITNR